MTIDQPRALGIVSCFYSMCTLFRRLFFLFQVDKSSSSGPFVLGCDLHLFGGKVGCGEVSRDWRGRWHLFRIAKRRWRVIDNREQPDGRWGVSLGLEERIWGRFLRGTSCFANFRLDSPYSHPSLHNACGIVAKLCEIPQKNPLEPAIDRAKWYNGTKSNIHACIVAQEKWEWLRRFCFS
jgi:hypothetical protein